MQWLPSCFNNFMCYLPPVDKIKNTVHAQSPKGNSIQGVKSGKELLLAPSLGDSKPLSGGNSSVKSERLMGLSEVGRQSKTCLKREREEVVCGRPLSHAAKTSFMGMQLVQSHRPQNSEGS